jgi:hypothetical protein
VKPWATRVRAAAVLAGCLVVLGIAVWLEPSPTGVGTHQGLGLAPCNLVVLTGYPCPTCGMTTAFAYAVRGQWWSAFNAQPAGLLLTLACGAATLLALIALVSGRGWVVNWYRISPSKLGLITLGLILAGWVYKLVIGWLNGTLPLEPF